MLPHLLPKGMNTLLFSSMKLDCRKIRKRDNSTFSKATGVLEGFLKTNQQVLSSFCQKNVRDPDSDSELCWRDDDEMVD